MKKKTRKCFVKQRDRKDCGPACLCSISAFYGASIPLAKAREAAKTDLNGTNAYGMIAGAEELGFSSEALSGSFEEFLTCLERSEFSLPVIAHTITEESLDHYIVIFDIDIENDRAVVNDPGKGRLILSIDAFKEAWTGVLITMEPKTELVSIECQRLAPLAIKLLKKNMALVLWVVFCSAVITGVGIAGAFLFQFVIDGIVAQFGRVQGTDLLNLLAQVCLVVCALNALGSGLSIARGVCLASLANKLDASIMLDFYTHLIKLPMSFFGTRKTGEILSRFSDSSKIRDAISTVAFTALIDAAMLVFGSILLWQISWPLACVAYCLFLLYSVLVIVYHRRLERNNQELMENNSQLVSYLKESVDGIETIKSLGCENTVTDRTTSKFYATIRKAYAQSVMTNNQSAYIGLFTSIATVIILWGGVVGIYNGVLTLGELIAFNSLLSYFLNPLGNIVGLQPQIQSALVAFNRLCDVNDLDIEDVNLGSRLEDNPFSIDIQNLSFSYGNRGEVLHSISLHALPGERIALVGESGSGKTTLAKLLMSFYEPDSGCIKVGSLELCTLKKSDYRSLVSYLSQDAFFFADTIRNNLKFGFPEASDEDIESVCKKCMLEDLLQDLPMGLDTQMEEAGLNFSSGQRQRIALARALLKKPRLLILDEATSNLDSITEQAIMESVFNVKSDTTCVIIAHRLSTISSCDRIIVIHDGRVEEEGNHQSLLNSKGRYYSYWKNQTSGR